MDNKTIVSISTPLGKGAVAIVRMSGNESLKIALKVFSAPPLTEKNIQPRMMYLGKLALEKDVFEECLMVYFKSPNSYTGEDIVEFQIHGGSLLAQKIVEVCLSNGAIMAEPGEYSKRAFLNGKITLDKAEAIIGEINAEAESELKSSLQITNGRLAEAILEEQEKLKTLLAEIEVGLDYPEETEETKLKSNINAVLCDILGNVKNIVKQSESAKYFKSGINVALVGKTNVGKSSIMNALLGEDRAIVTDIQGTTRDNITESFSHNGIKINLIDTAGIRETSDFVESVGIEKSKQILKTADIVLFILDGSEKMSEEDLEIKKLLSGKKHLYVINKTDKKRVIDRFENEIEVSALKNKNIEQLKDKICAIVIGEEIDPNALVLTNERQIQILKNAETDLQKILSEDFLSLDILSTSLKALWQLLGKITGNTENEDIIDLIFSKFCLGK